MAYPRARAGPADAGDLGYEVDPFADELEEFRRLRQPQPADLYAEYEGPRAPPEPAALAPPQLYPFATGGVYEPVRVEAFGDPQFRGQAFHRQRFRAVEPGSITSPETMAATVLEAVQGGYHGTARSFYIRAVDPESLQSVYR